MTKSDSSTSSAESEDSDSDLKDAMILAPNNRKHQAGNGIKTRKRYLTKIVPSLQAKAGHTQGSYVVLGASGPAITTNTPTKSILSDSEKPTIIQATLGESIHREYPTSISFVRDFLAKRFLLRARGRVSKTLAERFSSRYAELRKLKDLHFYSSKMLRASLTMTEEELSRSSFNRWMNWGTGSNGRFLTANISGFPRIGKEYSLSDILEEQVDEKYFLSQKQTNYLLKNLREGKESHLALTQIIGRGQGDNEPSC